MCPSAYPCHKTERTSDTLFRCVSKSKSDLRRVENVQKNLTVFLLVSKPNHTTVG